MIDLTWHVVLGFQFGAPGGEADFGETKEDDAEESFRTGTIVICLGKVGCRLCLLVSQRRFSSAPLAVSFSDGAIQCMRLAGIVVRDVS